MANLPPQLASADAFFAFLEVKKAERDFLEKFSRYRYTQVLIPKRRGGKRTLLIPEKRLKFLQKKTLSLLEPLTSPRRSVHGFVRGKSAVTNANEHQTRPHLLNLDLHNYFGTISRRRVAGMLQALGLDAEVASAICTICVTNNQLPQGAPTSPILSNLVAYSLDRDLLTFAKTHRLRYTRYADDISLSGYVQPMALFEDGVPASGRVPLRSLSSSFRRIFDANSFKIHEEKIWYSGSKFRKEVTGLIVNEFTNVKRTFVRDIRSGLYQAEKLGTKAAEKNYRKKYKVKTSLQSVLRGRLDWLAQVRGRSFSAYRTLAIRYNKLFPQSPLVVLPTNEEIAQRAVWIVEYFSGEQSAQGTAFFLKDVGLVTADHVLENLPPDVAADLFRPSEPNKKFKATPSLLRSAHQDLLVLDHSAPTTEYSELTLATSPEHTKDEIIALGFPDYGPGDELSKRRGHIVARTTKSSVKLIEVSANLSAGISGGPIVNERYQVIGIAKRGGNGENKQLAVDISELLQLVSKGPSLDLPASPLNPALKE